MGAIATSLVVAALLAAATAAGAGPRAEKLHLSRALGEPETIVAYDRSRLLLTGGYSEDTIRRIYDDGRPDRSFGDGGLVEMPVSGVTVAPGGKLLVASFGPSPTDPSDDDGKLTRLLPDGKPDPSFGDGGTAYVDFGGHYDAAYASAVSAGGDILLGGAKQVFKADRGGGNPRPAIARLLPNGTLDRGFGNDGVRILHGGGESGVTDISLTPAGGIVLAGEGGLGTAVWKLSRNGAVDRGFGKRGIVEISGHGKRQKHGWQEEVELLDEVVVLPDGKLLLAGTGNLYDGPDSPYRAVAVRLRRDGSVDRSYGDRGWAVAKIAGSTFVEGLVPLSGNALLLAASAQYDHDKRSDVGAIVLGPHGRTDPRFGRRGRLRVNLHGWDLAESATLQAGRAVVLGESGHSPNRWLVTLPPLRRP